MTLIVRVHKPSHGSKSGGVCIHIEISLTGELWFRMFCCHSNGLGTILNADIRYGTSSTVLRHVMLIARAQAVTWIEIKRSVHLDKCVLNIKLSIEYVLLP